jgi:hypothetical protein
VEKTESVAATIDGKFAARDKRFEERGEAREERVRRALRRTAQQLGDRMTQTTRKLADEVAHADAVREKNRKEMQRRVAAEREALERRNVAAEHIFQGRRDEIQQYQRALARRDLAIDQNITEKQKERGERLYAEKFAIEERQAAAGRARAAKDAQTALSLRQKTARSWFGIAEVTKQREKSQSALGQAEGTFVETRSAVLALIPELVDMNDRQRIKALMKVLHVSEEEATQIVEAARKPASLHECPL